MCCCSQCPHLFTASSSPVIAALAPRALPRRAKGLSRLDKAAARNCQRSAIRWPELAGSAPLRFCGPGRRPGPGYPHVGMFPASSRASRRPALFARGLGRRSGRAGNRDGAGARVGGRRGQKGRRRPVWPFGGRPLLRPSSSSAARAARHAATLPPAGASKRENSRSWNQSQASHTVSEAPRKAEPNRNPMIGWIAARAPRILAGPCQRLVAPGQAVGIGARLPAAGATFRRRLLELGRRLGQDGDGQRGEEAAGRREQKERTPGRAARTRPALP